MPALSDRQCLAIHVTICVCMVVVFSVLMAIYAKDGKHDESILENSTTLASALQSQSTAVTVPPTNQLIINKDSTFSSSTTDTSTTATTSCNVLNMHNQTLDENQYLRKGYQIDFFVYIGNLSNTAGGKVSLKLLDEDGRSVSANIITFRLRTLIWTADIEVANKAGQSESSEKEDLPFMRQHGGQMVRLTLINHEAVGDYELQISVHPSENQTVKSVRNPSKLHMDPLVNYNFIYQGWNCACLVRLHRSSTLSLVKTKWPAKPDCCCNRGDVIQ